MQDPKKEPTLMIPTPEKVTETGAPVDERFVKPEETPAEKRPKSSEKDEEEKRK